MKKITRCLWIVGLSLCPLLGCDVLTAILLSSSTSVTLVNNGDFDVAVSLYTSDTQEIPALLITQLGEQSTFTVLAGESLTFVRSCDDLQSIVIDDADLLVIGSVGPEANSNILRDGTDFSCGDTIIFTFNHSAVILDFDVTSSVIGF